MVSNAAIRMFVLATDLSMATDKDSKVVAAVIGSAEVETTEITTGITTETTTGITVTTTTIDYISLHSYHRKNSLICCPQKKITEIHLDWLRENYSFHLILLFFSV